MKKTIYLSIIVVALIFTACQYKEKKTTVIDKHSTEYTLDCEGIYKGTSPCTDCNGIETALTLNPDKTFVYETVYWGKENGRFVHKGKYAVKEKILTIQQDGKPTHFLVGENAVILLGDDLKPNKGKEANFYVLKKQGSFNYQGKYETFNEEKGGYTQTLSIQLKGNDYEITFFASKVKDRENCRFTGIGNIKNDTLWVNISNEKDKEVPMYIAPSHDNLGVEVFTADFKERFYMMRYCGGGGSLAGKYFKNTVTANSISVFNKQNTIAEILQTLPNAQVQKKKGEGKFTEDVYDDYEIYNRNGRLLFTLTPKDIGDAHQKINTVMVNSSLFKTDKGITVNATFGEIKKAYKINGFATTRAHITFNVDEINANFSIAKTKLPKDWWDDETKKVNEDKIPLNTQVDDFTLWWIDKAVIK